MNLQVTSSLDGEALWVSAPLAGSVHDLTAARIWGIIRQLAAAGLITLADRGYIDSGQRVLVPYRAAAIHPRQTRMALAICQRARRSSELPVLEDAPAQGYAERHPHAPERRHRRTK
jgi:hypothetical protein